MVFQVKIKFISYIQHSGNIIIPDVLRYFSAVLQGFPEITDRLPEDVIQEDHKEEIYFSCRSLHVDDGFQHL